MFEFITYSMKILKWIDIFKISIASKKGLLQQGTITILVHE